MESYITGAVGQTMFGFLVFPMTLVIPLKKKKISETLSLPYSIKVQLGEGLSVKEVSLQSHSYLCFGRQTSEKSLVYQ